MKINKQLFLSISLFVSLHSCTEESVMHCNLDAAVYVLCTASQPCSGTGSIQITEPVGANYQYKIDNLPFQNQSLFLNVKMGKHTLVVKDQNGCEVVKEVMVETSVGGTKFNEVKQILSNRCANCHSGNNPQAGLDFTNTCDIIKHWERIQERAVFGIPTPMPQGGYIPLDERNKIVEWISNGHTYED